MQKPKSQKATITNSGAQSSLLTVLSQAASANSEMVSLGESIN